jgi:hypothetical protein
MCTVLLCNPALMLHLLYLQNGHFGRKFFAVFWVHVVDEEATMNAVDSLSCMNVGPSSSSYSFTEVVEESSFEPLEERDSTDPMSSSSFNFTEEVEETSFEPLEEGNSTNPLAMNSMDSSSYSSTSSCTVEAEERAAAARAAAKEPPPPLEEDSSGTSCCTVEAECYSDSTDIILSSSNIAVAATSAKLPPPLPPQQKLVVPLAAAPLLKARERPPTECDFCDFLGDSPVAYVKHVQLVHSHNSTEIEYLRYVNRDNDWFHQLEKKFLEEEEEKAMEEILVPFYKNLE